MTDQPPAEASDTADAAPPGGRAKELSGRQKAAIALGPFFILWLVWWRVGAGSMSRLGKFEGDSGAVEWL